MPLPVKKNKKYLLLLFFLHLPLLAILFWKFGINTGNEADKYLSSATELINGNVSKALEYQWFYSVFIFYLAFLMALKVPVIFIFVLTWLFSLFCFYRFFLFLETFCSAAIAKIWLALIMLSPVLLFWELYLYSEIFFISLSLLFISAIFSAQKGVQYLSALFLALLLVFTRPSGIFTVICVFTAFLLHKKILNKKVLLFSASLDVILIFFVLIFFIPMHHNGVCIPIASGSVYCGFPMFQSNDFPEADQTLASSYAWFSSRYGLPTTLLIIAKKFFSFFVFTRPHYSFFHNLVNALHYIFYPLAIAGFFASRKEKFLGRLLKSCMFIILLNALLVAVFFNEWTERYTVQVLPYIFLCAAPFIQSILQKIKRSPAI